jgi:hypothetical protein
MSETIQTKNQSLERSKATSEEEALRVGELAARGMPFQCQFCPGQAFRRSRLRSSDLRDILMMRYPVRCLRCSQRQMVSFTIAGISVPSHVKQRRARHDFGEAWKEPVKESLKPKPVSRTQEPAAEVQQQEKQSR